MKVFKTSTLLGTEDEMGFPIKVVSHAKFFWLGKSMLSTRLKVQNDYFPCEIKQPRTLLWHYKIAANVHIKRKQITSPTSAMLANDT